MRYVEMLILAVGASTISVVAVGAASQNEILPLRHATVFLQTDRSEYGLGDTIVIDAGIRNEGREPIYVYNQLDWGPRAGFVLRLRDAAGRLIQPALRDDTLMPPPKADDAGILSRLEPATFFGLRRRMAVSDLVRRGGSYSIEAEYQSPLSRELVLPQLSTLPALWLESQILHSNSVTINISK